MASSWAAARRIAPIFARASSGRAASRGAARASVTRSANRPGQPCRHERANASISPGGRRPAPRPRASAPAAARTPGRPGHRRRCRWRRGRRPAGRRAAGCRSAARRGRRARRRGRSRAARSRPGHAGSAAAGPGRHPGRCLELEPDPAEVRVVLETRHGLLVEALADAGERLSPVHAYAKHYRLLRHRRSRTAEALRRADGPVLAGQHPRGRPASAGHPRGRRLTSVLEGQAPQAFPGSSR
jgi:hypothetical protein